MSERRPVLEWTEDRRNRSKARIGEFVLWVDALAGSKPRVWRAEVAHRAHVLAVHDMGTLLAAQIAAEDAAREAGIAVPETAPTFRQRIEAALNVTGYDDDYLVSEVERNALRVIEAAKQETVQANLLAAAKAVCAAQIIDDRIEVLIGLRERVRAHFYDVRFERTDAVISELQSVRDQIKNDLTARSTATEVDRSVKPAGDGRTGGDASAEAAP